jgi:hypothetical protein
MSLGDRFYQIQSEAGPVRLIPQCAAASKKRMEDTALLFDRDSRSAVGHANLDSGAVPIVNPGTRDADPSSCAEAVLHCIVEKVLQSLPQSAWIGHHQGRTGSMLVSMTAF